MTRHFCTYFDSNYALRGLALFRSMHEHCGDFVLHVLCCDAQTFGWISALEIENLRPYRLEEIEAFEPRLAHVKPARNRAEYLWTLSPIWPLFLLETQPEIELICYLDADLFFFGSDTPIWEEFGANSVLIIEHRFSPHTQYLFSSGRFNVGMVAYRRDEDGLRCLNWYRERTLEWCFNIHEENRYGDQKYLDEFPNLFQKVHILEHPGANVAPWNWMNGPLQWRDDAFWVGEKPLIFYHFHGFKMFSSRMFDISMNDAGYGLMPRDLGRQLGETYISALSAARRWGITKGVAIPWAYTRRKNYGLRLFVAKLRQGRFYFRRGSI